MDSQTLALLAAKALENRAEAQAEAQLADWLALHPDDAIAAHWRALLLRALDRRDEAVPLLEHAARRVPGNAGLLHALAHIRLEAGLPSSAAFERAIGAAPANLEIRVGLASARFAEGAGQVAQRELVELLTRQPDWLAGHRTFAQLAAMMGEPNRAFETIDRAIERRPDMVSLYQLGCDLRLDAHQPAAALAVSEAALQRFGPQQHFSLGRAAALDELGDLPAARQAFTGLPAPRDPGHAVRLIRHLFRADEVDIASGLLDRWLDTPSQNLFWPLAALAWRATGDPRSAWLEQRDGLVRVIDLDQADINLTELTALLRQLHARSGRFLDQSVQHGTQTDGPFFARIEAPVKLLRAAIVDAVGAYLAALPPVEPAHPTLREPRDVPIRFAGSWSVRLDGAGHHSSHHHPQGWISSAFYAAVPENLGGDEGRLVLGEVPPNLGLQLSPSHVVEPRPGRLVLFPSFMWHGTRQFSGGERISVAFDVARA